MIKDAFLPLADPPSKASIARKLTVDNFRPFCYRFAYWVEGLVPRIKTGGKIYG